MVPCGPLMADCCISKCITSTTKDFIFYEKFCETGTYFTFIPLTFQKVVSCTHNRFDGAALLLLTNFYAFH